MVAQHQRITGKLLAGTAINPTLFTGVSTLDELWAFGLKEPMPMAKTSRNKTPVDDLGLKDLRAIIQRAWDKSRYNRAEVYSRYLRGLYEGTIVGGVPPITVYVKEQGFDNGLGGIQFGWRAPCVSLDGETQLQARYLLQEEIPETSTWPFAVVVHHGITEEAAIQILHDLNAYAKPIPESKLGSRNTTGPMSKAIEAALVLANLKTENLNMSGTVGARGTFAAFTQLMAFVAGFTMGDRALRQGAAKWYGTLNSPTSQAAVPGAACSKALASLLGMAVHDKRLQGAPGVVWQVLGVLAAEGVEPKDANLDKGFFALKTTTGGGRGGPRMAIGTRLDTLHEAFKG